MKPTTQAALIIGAALLIRLIFAASMGLGIDESYMVSAAHTYQLSYFDHPPMSWFMELTIQRLTGLHSPFIVRLPFVLLFAGTGVLMYGLTNRLFGARAAVWAVAGLNISPVFAVAFGTWVLPDGPLDFFLVAAAWALARAVGVARPALGAEPEPGFWPLAGLCAGLAMTSKYNAALNLLGALAFLMFDARGRRALASSGPWLACLIALLVFSPVLIWNALNHWASFGYQGARATGFGIHPLRPFIVWAGEAVFIAPWIFVPMIALLIGGFRRGADRRARFLAWLAVVPIVLFSAIAFWSTRKILFHWAAPGYLMLFPLLGDWAARARDSVRRRLAAGVWATASLLTAAVVFIGAELHFDIVPGFNAHFAQGHSPELQVIDWRSFRAALVRRGDLAKPDMAVAALRWFDAGKIAYALGPDVPVTVFEGDKHEFGITTPPQSLIGDDILIAAMPGNEADIMKRYAPRFRAITIAKPIAITHHGHVLLRIPMLLGHDLQSWPLSPG
ncbi:ArnT family glycosyltransferase [Acidiphilium sp.]|uniref:ArnT family glycosyltransferase n=1 Tax=Acidiphilium sp. TaxID=527 RepID=UPI003D01B302